MRLLTENSLSRNSKVSSYLVFSLFVLFLSLAHLEQNAQGLKRNNVWMLGDYGVNNMGLDFNGGSADTFSIVRNMRFFLTNGSICDTTGQLLFYSNGDYIANRNHFHLNNTVNFNPTLTGDTVLGANILQGLIFLPYCNIPNQYIVFHENREYFIAHGFSQDRPIQLRYSVLDLTLDGGLGGIVSGKKTIPIINDTLTIGLLSACKHGNGRDWWVVTRQYYDSVFYKILITPDTITVTTQSIGPIIIYDSPGQSMFSPDGNKFAMRTGSYTTDIYDFDRCSGMFSNKQTIYHYDIINSGQDTLANAGCAFSPSGRYLYVTNNLFLHQLDTWAPVIGLTDSIIGEWDTTYAPLATTFAFMSLAPDDKIYLSTWNGTNVLHVINYPDSLGPSCGFVQHGLILPSYNALTFPNATNYGLGSMIGSICDTLISTIDLPGVETRSSARCLP